ncbi:hypothetical protein D2E76_16620 [Mycobacteroides abscessus]|uniref:Uncharacterized protein n=1 Tax=Mycobacteroides abscessus TaxID=36809 RepID=A0ABD7HM79_9MYCO|nr:hypothetical protein D2E76_16620 [Mycobacteroides abscessus]
MRSTAALEPGSGAPPVTSRNAGTVWNVFDADSHASTPQLHLEAPDDLPLPDRFTMEHWQYLYGSGKFAQLPFRLAPFPPLAHKVSDLADQLVAWNIVDPSTGELAEDAEGLLTDLTRDYSHAVFGQVTFPEEAFVREFDFPAEAEHWGLPKKQLIIPQVPFLITVCDNGRVTSAVSTASALSINTSTCDASDVPAGCFAREILHILDPDGLRGPRNIPSFRIPRSAAEAFGADPVLGRRRAAGEKIDEKELDEAIMRVARETGVPRSTVAVLAQMNKAPVAAQMSVVAARATATGEDISMGSAVEVWLLGGADRGMAAKGPARDQGGNLMVQYCPATSSDLTQLIKALFEETSVDETALPEDLRKAWHRPFTLG